MSGYYGSSASNQFMRRSVHHQQQRWTTTLRRTESFPPRRRPNQARNSDSIATIILLFLWNQLVKFATAAWKYYTAPDDRQIYDARENRGGQVHEEQIRIPDNATGFSYGRIFKPLLDDQVTSIEVEDPYIRSPHQVFNFVRFCDLVAQNARRLKSITLTTGKEQDEEKMEKQEASLRELGIRLLRNHNILLTVRYSETLHDREIRFNNGWVVNIGRGLDYFKWVPKGTRGYHDMNDRPCHETTVNIFKRRP